MATRKPAVKIEITPPHFQTITLRAIGASPLMMHRFPEKARKQIEEKQTAKDATRAKRQPKDYDREFNDAKYVSTAGWEGIPTRMFRASMINACRLVNGLTMTLAKDVIRVDGHGRDRNDSESLIRIHGKSVRDTRPVRLESGVADMRNRPRYDDWYCDVSISFDADKLTANDVANLFARAGLQIGIGELRPHGANSFGGDFGTWTVDAAPKKRCRTAKS